LIVIRCKVCDFHSSYKTKRVALDAIWHHYETEHPFEKAVFEMSATSLVRNRQSNVPKSNTKNSKRRVP
jgi:hypothetical protein